jgi:outer membrane lipoprotein-sorting protein
MSEKLKMTNSLRFLFPSCLFSFLCFIGISFCAISQPQNYILLTGSAKTNIETKIKTASQNISSMQCKFVQKKTSTLLSEQAVSKGLLFYKSPNSLRWQYTEPNPLVLIFHRDNVCMQDEKGKFVSANKMLKQLGNFIISNINGNSLVENGNFKIDYYSNEKDKTTVWIKLTPVARRLKEMYTSIQIKISTADYLAMEIIMEEISGDKTTISFFDKKINNTISDNQFSIN